MSINLRHATVAAVALILGTTAVASASIKLPPLLPLQPGGGTTQIKGDVHSVIVSNPWGSVTAIAGNSTSITQTSGANLSGPSAKESLKDGVLTIKVSCLGVGPETDGLSLNGVLDLVNSCTDDLKIVMPSDATLEVTGEQGTITTSGINGVQKLTNQLGDVNASSSSAPLVTAVTKQGNVNLSDLRSSIATAKTEYGYVSIHSSDIDSIQTSVIEGGLSIKDSIVSFIDAVATSHGGIDISDTTSPSSLVAKTAKGAISVVVPEGTYDLTTKTPDSILVSNIKRDASSSHHVSATSEEGNININGALSDG